MKNSLQVNQTSSPGNKWLHFSYFSLVISLVVFILVGLFWWRASIYYQKYLVDINRARVQNRLDGIATSLTSAINHRQALLTGLAAFIKSSKNEVNFDNQLAVYASGLYADDPVVRAIEFFPVNGTELIYPENKNETLKGRKLDDLINDSRPDVRADVQRAIQIRKITLSNPYELLQGGKGVVARLAVYDGSKFLGLTVIVLNLEPLLEVPGLYPAPTDLQYYPQRYNGSLVFRYRERIG